MNHQPYVLKSFETQVYELKDYYGLTEAEEDSASPSHSDSDVSSGQFVEPWLIHSKRECKLPSMFLNFLPGFSATTVDIRSLSDGPESYDQIAFHDYLDQRYQAVHDELDSCEWCLETCVLCPCVNVKAL